jgi:hypothetical protein
MRSRLLAKRSLTSNARGRSCETRGVGFWPSMCCIRQLFRTTITDLYRYVSRRCGGQSELAEDVTQESWLRAIKDWNPKGIPPNPIGWLTTVARNLLLNHFRHRETLSLDDVSAAEILAAFDDANGRDSAELASIVSHARPWSLSNHDHSDICARVSHSGVTGPHQ